MSHLAKQISAARAKGDTEAVSKMEAIEAREAAHKRFLEHRFKKVKT